MYKYVDTQHKTHISISVKLHVVGILLIHQKLFNISVIVYFHETYRSLASKHMHMNVQLYVYYIYENASYYMYHTNITRY